MDVDPQDEALYGPSSPLKRGPPRGDDGENYPTQRPRIGGENDADFFTKVLPGRKFFPLRNKIMNIADSELDVPRSRGGVEV